MRIMNIVNAEKRACVVVISDMGNDLRRDLRRKLKNSDDIGFYCERSYLNGPIRGIAKCSPEDEFDPERGLAIATARAMKSYNTLYNNELNELIGRIVRDLSGLTKNPTIDPSVHFPV